MQGKNRYFRRSHLWEAKFRALIRYFAHDLRAWKIAELSSVSRPTINQLFMKLRIRIAQVCNASSPLFGEVEVDESYFGARRVRGKKGRGAGGKPIVFGILERHGKVSEIVPDASRKQLQSAIRGQEALEASSTRTVGEATIGWWTWATKRISGCITGCITGCIMASMSLPTVIAISMALSHSGHMPNGGLQSSMPFPDKRSFGKRQYLTYEACQLFP